MELTDEVRSLAESIKAKADEIDALPIQPPEQSTGSCNVFPTPVNCLGGTSPATISIPAGDGTPTGGQGEPAYTRRMNNTPDGSVGIFGDSILQSMHENLMSPYAVNFALGGQSLRRMINQLHGMPFMATAGAGVIMCGVNDLGNTTYYGARTNHQAALTVLGMHGNQLKNWLTGKWVICHLLPIVNGLTDSSAYKAQIEEVNTGLPSAYAGCPAQIEFLPVPSEILDVNGYLKPEMALGDGQHPSKLLECIYTPYIWQALKNLGVNP